MLTKEKVLQTITDALNKLKIECSPEALTKITISYTEPQFGDYSSNAALILAKEAKMKPADLAKQIVDAIDQGQFEKVEVAGPGFINFKLKTEELVKSLLNEQLVQSRATTGKILLEYFQPNIAKPLHIGHLRTAIIGDTIKRMLIHVGQAVESDTHMGDWGTQFGYLIMVYKKHGEVNDKLYAQLNNEAEKDKSIHEQAKLEFSKLEQGDAENRKIWQTLVDQSVQEFLKINDLMDILPFDHHWPESFYEDKMPAVVDQLKQKGLLVESQGAQIVNLEDYNLGVAIIIKSDKSTTYLLRDLAGFNFIKQEGFKKHLYVVDNRQSLHYQQLFKILELMGEMVPEEGRHINYGFISFKGEALSTRKGNMVLATDVIAQMEEKVAKIIQDKNPDLADKQVVIKAVTKAALKYYDLSHNRNSDYEFNWDEALDFDGNSGPYLQYVYARLSSILRKVDPSPGLRPPSPSGRGIKGEGINPTETERQVMFELTKLDDMVAESLKDYLPNIFANYLYHLAGLLNKFYHRSPVLKETDENKKQFRLQLIASSRKVFGKGLDLLGIKALEEM